MNIYSKLNTSQACLNLVCVLEKEGFTRVKLSLYMTTGIILAGGCSKRARTNKLLLKVDSKPLISHTIDSLKNHVDKIIVVTGHYDKELRPYLNDVEIAYNKDYELGMFSSVLTGIRLCDDEVIILPGDMTNISHKTFETLLDNKKVISIPTFKGETGHPLFLNKQMVNLLKKEDIKSNLREFINKHIDQVNYVEVNDPFIKFDIDTIEDYTNFINKRKELSYEG